ncbi:DsbA family oxidoreductase [Dongia soli]|uniref:DsbA family oxidoreductase n=1 Tax=Dongia soli TaxID=600628 RepID=A0ABU5EB61_9PROT|nr:DsbA family oxidoreductase [Dongia soli]MDY0883117.1 DsbA family oxidoreductase [Dongia soli]
MQLDIFSDTICPWCYIGKRRLERALQARPQPNLQLRWRAFQLNPGMPATGMERQQYMTAKFGSVERASRLYDTVTRIGAAEGITFRFDLILRTPNTLMSHRLCYVAATADLQDAMLDRLYMAYFQEGLDIGDATILASLAREVDVPSDLAAEALAGTARIDTALASDFQARRQGINGVPYFIFNGRFGLSGAQEPEALFHMLDLAREDDALQRSA